MFPTLHARRRDRGFSFIELLAYMAIAALLILAAVPQFNQYRQKAVVANMRDTAHNAALAAEAANIDAVSAHSTGNGGIRLASARMKLVAASQRFEAIKTAVLAVKKNDGEAVAVTDTGSSEYFIAVTSTKAAAGTEVVYASSYTTQDGIAFAPGQSTLVGGALVGAASGGEPGTTPSTGGAALANAACTTTQSAARPAPTIVLDQNITKRQAFLHPWQFVMSAQVSDSKVLRFDPGDGSVSGGGQMQNVKMWIGNQEVCEWPELTGWVTYNTNPYYDMGSSIPNYSITINGGSRANIMTSAQATAKSDVTVAFDWRGRHYVALTPWGSDWDQGGTLMTEQAPPPSDEDF